MLGTAEWTKARDVALRPATMANVDALCAIHRRCSQDSLYRRYLMSTNEVGPASMRRLLTDTTTTVVEAADGQLVGPTSLVDIRYRRYRLSWLHRRWIAHSASTFAIVAGRRATSRTLVHSAVPNLEPKSQTFGPSERVGGPWYRPFYVRYRGAYPTSPIRDHGRSRADSPASSSYRWSIGKRRRRCGRKVGHPQAVLRGGGEVALHEVRPAVRAGPGQRRPRAFRTGDAPPASGFHQPLHRAAGDRSGVHTAGTAELRVDLADPIHAVVLLVHLADLGRDLLIADRPRRGRPGPRRVVGARGDRDISAGQH